MLTRTIPSTGEPLAAVGLGTWRTFDVGRSAAERRPLEDLLARFAARGGQLVDSSPMYGRSEAVVGEIAEKPGLTGSLFLATKVWTIGREAGVAQIAESRRRLRKSPLDLIQVHNLLDVETQLETLAEKKAGGEVRYVGISHYTPSAYGEIARLLSREGIDFVQITFRSSNPRPGRGSCPWPPSAESRSSPTVPSEAARRSAAWPDGRCPHGPPSSTAGPGRSSS